MKLTLNWLKDYVKIDDLSVDFIRDKLLNIGLEVESTTYLAGNIKNIVTGKIVELYKHPKADKLSVCLVDIGSPAVIENSDQKKDDEKTIKIITGATNIKAGDIVPVALNGAVLADGKKIFSADFRGEISDGMLCSGNELGINDAVIDGAEVDGLLVLPPDTELGLDIKQFLGLDDYVLDISVTANRGDCNSVYGIARELAVALKRDLKPLFLEYKVSAIKTTLTKAAQNINVKIQDKQFCSLYQGAIVDNAVIRPSPLWLRRRLWACGMGCKNNIVDITNYVLLEVGQPLHAFDIGCIDGSVLVRNARPGEKIKALNGLTYDLKENMLLIADETKALAIAGVMGGEYSGICPKTKAIFLESARFARGGVRQTSRILGLRSDSSARFEKGVDDFCVETGRKRALALIDMCCAGQVCQDLIKDGVPAAKDKIIDIKYKQFKEILGISVPHDTIKDILTRLSFKLSEINDTAGKTVGLRICVPSFREDIDNFTDVIEEVIRFYGYDKLEGTRYKSGMAISGGISKRRENINKIESICCAVGAFEINNFSFIPPRHADMLLLENSDSRRHAIKILNPISEDLSLMRTQLVSSMLETIRRNRSRQNDDFALFEIENVFVADLLPLENLPKENLTLCVGFCQKGKDFYDVKAFATALISEFVKDFRFEPAECTTQPFLHPGISTEVVIEGQKAGFFGKIHPSVAKNFEIADDIYILEINLEPLVNNDKPIVRYVPLPKFPFVQRDFAVVVDADRPVGEIVGIVKSADTLIKNVETFDIYTGEQMLQGKKSIALRVTILNIEKTMTEVEINAVCDKLVQQLRTAGANLR